MLRVAQRALTGVETHHACMLGNEDHAKLLLSQSSDLVDPLSAAIAATAISETGFDGEENGPVQLSVLSGEVEKLFLAAIAGVRRLALQDESRASFAKVDPPSSQAEASKHDSMAVYANVYELYGWYLLESQNDASSAIAQADAGLELDPGNIKLMQLKAEAASAASAGRPLIAVEDPSANKFDTRTMLIPADSLDHLLKELTADRGNAAESLHRTYPPLAAPIAEPTQGFTAGGTTPNAHRGGAGSVASGTSGQASGMQKKMTWRERAAARKAPVITTDRGEVEVAGSSDSRRRSASESVSFAALGAQEVEETGDEGDEEDAEEADAAGASAASPAATGRTASFHRRGMGRKRSSAAMTVENQERTAVARARLNGLGPCCLASAMVLRGRHLQSQGRLDDAEDEYRRAAAADPENADALGSLAAFLHVHRALPALQRSTVKESDGVTPGGSSGAGEKGSGNRPEESSSRLVSEVQNAYDAALLVDPHHANNLGNLGLFQFNVLEDAHLAQETYARALDVDPEHANTLYNAGVLADNHQHDSRGAIALYQRCVAADPGHSFAHYNLAVLLEDAIEDFDGAEKHYRSSLHSSPRDVVTRLDYAQFLESKRGRDGPAALHAAAALRHAIGSAFWTRHAPCVVLGGTKFDGTPNTLVAGDATTGRMESDEGLKAQDRAGAKRAIQLYLPILRRAQKDRLQVGLGSGDAVIDKYDSSSRAKAQKDIREAWRDTGCIVAVDIRNEEWLLHEVRQVESLAGEVGAMLT